MINELSMRSREGTLASLITVHNVCPLIFALLSLSLSVIDHNSRYVCGTHTNGTHVCYEDYLIPGEILYYGHGWHHETQNLETPTMTITDTVAHQNNYQSITEMLHGTCARDLLRFGFSARKTIQESSF